MSGRIDIFIRMRDIAYVRRRCVYCGIKIGGRLHDGGQFPAN